MPLTVRVTATTMFRLRVAAQIPFGSNSELPKWRQTRRKNVLSWTFPKYPLTQGGTSRIRNNRLPCSQAAGKAAGRNRGWCQWMPEMPG
jgi:hypothetical protein